MASRLKEKYQQEVMPNLLKAFNYKNPMQVPGVHKVVVNIGMGEVIQNAKAMDAAVADLAAIT
ncbi:MAG TPA: 50S ribosomal protein L5, partial [Ktedonobacteraceae bacterium]|nr:50S ribosomal protein L5 [Ktedonobacteraceae bacterium]